MCEKRVKNEQLYIKELIEKINNNEIIKPKYQRKKKWDILPKKNNNPNEQEYITFLFDTHNSVHAITFGQNTIDGKIIFNNIDGNNRINAIKHFIDKPFEIFPEKLDLLKNIIKNIEIDNNKITEDEINTIMEIFKNISYTDLINIKNIKRYFKIKQKEQIYIEYLDKINLKIEKEIENIQQSLKINGDDNFDTNVKINVNLFEGYTTDELCKIFEDINKFNSCLTEHELLACHLHDITDFSIEDTVTYTEIKHHLKLYYENKSENEALECYNYNLESLINAYDFIIGFQNYHSSKYNIIEKHDNKGLSLYFKIYINLYGTIESKPFTSENVNDFITKINNSCELLNKIINTIFTNSINDILFNSKCKKKIETLPKNKLYLILTSIIGYYNKNENESKIIKSIEKCILFHFCINDLEIKEIREEFKDYDKITYRAGGSVIDNEASDLKNKPENISNKITKEIFSNLINKLYEENNSEVLSKNSRRLIKFYEKCILFYYYKEKIPTNYFDKKFSIEHICPFSCTYDNKLDIDNIGNLIPILHDINSTRGNRHISTYSDSDFIQYISEIIPDTNTYDNIVLHNDTKPKIINKNKYNELCKKNREIYLNNFIIALD